MIGMLNYKERHADEFITPPNFTVFQNMKLLHKKQHVTSSICDVIDSIYNV